MSGKERPHAGITRRSFLKSTGAVAGAAALGASTPTLQALAASSPEATEEKTYSGVCRGNCFQGCFVSFTVRDEKIVKVTARDYPDPAYNRICPKGLSLIQRFYNKDRLKYPMKRVGPRGSDQWERISWDEAVETICSAWEKIQQEHGKNCIGHSTVAGNTGVSLSNMDILFKLIGTVNVASNVDNALFKGTRDTLGWNVGQNGANDSTDIENAKTVVIWGSNMSESQIQQWHFVADAKENGAKLICIDPNYTAMAAKSDIFVPVRPGTDAALTMAMMNIVIQNGWTDVDYLKKATVAPLLVKEDEKYLRMSDLGVSPSESTDPKTGKTVKNDPFVVWDESAQTFGEVNKVADPAIEGSYEIEGFKVATAYSLLLKRIEKYTPEYSAEICDLPVELIHEITEVYTKNSPSFIYQGLGAQHYVNGHYNYIATATLAMLTGNLGKPGASCGFIRPACNYNSAAATSVAQAKRGSSDVIAIGAASGDKQITTEKIPIIASNKVPDVVETGKYGDFDVPLKSLYIYKSNYLGVLTDRKRQIEAFEKMDMVVVADMYMTDSARYADIVLPVADWAELYDTHNRTLYPFVLLQEKAIEPLYESKPDFEIAQLLGERLGFGEYFTRSLEEFLEEYTGKENWAKLKEDKALWMPYFAENGYRYIHGEKGVFPTDTKRAQFYLEAPNRGLYGDDLYGQEIDYTKERMTFWEPPHEAWHENELFEKYPLTLWQEHVKWRTHTQFGYVPWIKEMDPEPIIKMSDQDAAQRGIATGDIVRVFNDRGYVVLKAVIDNGARPGMVNIPHGWQENQFIEGHYGDLLSSAMNPIVSNQCYNDCLVEVEKYKEG